MNLHTLYIFHMKIKVTLQCLFYYVHDYSALLTSELV